MINHDQPNLEKLSTMPQASSTLPLEIINSCATIAVLSKREKKPEIAEAAARLWDTVINAYAGQTGGPGTRTPKAPATPGATNKPRAARGPNKTTQSIIACITADTTGKGLTPTMIATATSLAKELVTKRLASLEKSKQVSQKGGRFSVAGTGTPQVVARRQATVTSINAGAGKTRIRKATTTKSGEISLANAVLQAVNAIGQETQPAEVMTYLKTNFGLSPRANHLGIAMNRHVKAKRLTKRGNLYSMPAAGYGTQPQGDLAAAG